jgi:hypothetical protein
LAKRNLWVDRPSAGIPFLFIRTGVALATALDGMSLQQEAAKVRAQTERIARATQLEDVFANMTR